MRLAGRKFILVWYIQLTECDLNMQFFLGGEIPTEVLQKIEKEGSGIGLKDLYRYIM